MEIITDDIGVCDALLSSLFLKYQFSQRPNDAESLRQYVRFKVTYLIANQQGHIDQPTNQANIQWIGVRWWYLQYVYYSGDHPITVILESHQVGAAANRATLTLYVMFAANPWFLC